MAIGHLSSSESDKCSKCNRKTSTYKTYKKTGIEIRIPLCETNKRNCWDSINLEKIAYQSIRTIRKDIIKQVEQLNSTNINPNRRL